MVRALIVAALLALSFSPVDAREPAKPVPDADRPVARAPSDLRRDIERISSEIYRPAPPARAPKKR
jgi:hypothetical protein